MEHAEPPRAGLRTISRCSIRQWIEQARGRGGRGSRHPKRTIVDAVILRRVVPAVLLGALAASFAACGGAATGEPRSSASGVPVTKARRVAAQWAAPSPTSQTGLR